MTGFVHCWSETIYILSTSFASVTPHSQKKTHTIHIKRIRICEWMMCCTTLRTDDHDSLSTSLIRSLSLYRFLPFTSFFTNQKKLFIKRNLFNVSWMHQYGIFRCALHNRETIIRRKRRKFDSSSEHCYQKDKKKREPEENRINNQSLESIHLRKIRK